jgi:hypothetical protein
MKIINGLLIITIICLLIVSGCVSNEKTKGTPPNINNAASVISPDQPLNFSQQTIINNAASAASPDQPLHVVP